MLYLLSHRCLIFLLHIALFSLRVCFGEHRWRSVALVRVENDDYLHTCELTVQFDRRNPMHKLLYIFPRFCRIGVSTSSDPSTAW